MLSGSDFSVSQSCATGYEYKCSASGAVVCLGFCPPECARRLELTQACLSTGHNSVSRGCRILAPSGAYSSNRQKNQKKNKDKNGGGDTTRPPRPLHPGTPSIALRATCLRSALTSPVGTVHRCGARSRAVVNSERTAIQLGVD